MLHSASSVCLFMFMVHFHIFTIYFRVFLYSVYIYIYVYTFMKNVYTFICTCKTGGSREKTIPKKTTLSIIIYLFIFLRNRWKYKKLINWNSKSECWPWGDTSKCNKKQNNHHKSNQIPTHLRKWYRAAFGRPSTKGCQRPSAACTPWRLPFSWLLLNFV